ncbi:MAG: hypothetical protein Fur005_23040 [Roseiflexaceae bacterium]
MGERQRMAIQRRTARRRVAHEAEAPASAAAPSFAFDSGLLQQSAHHTHPNTSALRQGALQRLQSGWGNSAIQRFLADLSQATGMSIAQREEGNPVAPADAGTSTHPTIRYGSRGPAVEELQQKLNDNGATPALDPDGIFGPLTRAAVIAFQQQYSLDPDGIVGPLTWAQIDQLGLASTVGRVEKTWSEEVGGQTYGMTSRFTWRLIGDKEMLVTVKLKFTGLKRPDLVSRWFGHIRSIWNRFDAVGPSGEHIAINFDPQSVASGEDNVVRIRPGNGRSDAANWFAEDPDSDTTAAHEFGHMIGLEDEYQRSHTDYKRLTGEEPKPGEDNAADPKIVAQQMRTALTAGTEAERVTACNAVIATHQLEQGFYAQHVAKEYKDQFGNDLIRDIVDNIPDEDEWSIVDPFTFSSDSIMGIGGDHEHPVDPRHVREFIGYISQAKGGDWVAEER